MRAATSLIPDALLAARWAFRRTRLPLVNPNLGTFIYVYPPSLLVTHESGTEKQHFISSVVELETET